MTEKTDGELLSQFVATKNEKAFEEIVSRHGPMVLGTCKRILLLHHDAEDAYQTVFMILAKKAQTLRNKDSLGGWLHGVAMHSSLNAKKQVASRKRHEEKYIENDKSERNFP